MNSEVWGENIKVILYFNFVMYRKCSFRMLKDVHFENLQEHFPCSNFSLWKFSEVFLSIIPENIYYIWYIKHTKKDPLIS